MEAITLDDRSVVVASNDQASTELAGEAVIVDVRSGTYYGLDGVGARIWTLIQKPRRVSEVRDALVAEYDVDATRCGEDLLALLRELAAARLIEVRRDQPA